MPTLTVCHWHGHLDGEHPHTLQTDKAFSVVQNTKRVDIFSVRVHSIMLIIQVMTRKQVK